MIEAEILLSADTYFSTNSHDILEKASVFLKLSRSVVDNDYHH
jgi:hypothetical protein